MKCRKLCNIWASREQELALLRLYTFIFFFSASRILLLRILRPVDEIS